MKNIIFILCILAFSSVKSQHLYKTENVGYIKSFEDYLKTMDTSKIKKDNMQIRFWFGNGANKINITCLLLLTSKHKKWKGHRYVFTRYYHNEDKNTIQRIALANFDNDSLNQVFVKDSLFALKNDNVDTLIYGENAQLYWPHSPTYYYIEIITA